MNPRLQLRVCFLLTVPLFGSVLNGKQRPKPLIFLLIPSPFFPGILLSRKPPETPGKRIRFLERTIVEKNGQGIKPWEFDFLPTNGFSIQPLKVSLLAGEQKATRFGGCAKKSNVSQLDHRGLPRCAESLYVTCRRWALGIKVQFEGGMGRDGVKQISGRVLFPFWRRRLPACKGIPKTHFLRWTSYLVGEPF